MSDAAGPTLWLLTIVHPPEAGPYDFFFNFDGRVVDAHHGCECFVYKLRVVG